MQAEGEREREREEWELCQLGLAAVAEGDGSVAHCGPHSCLCNLGNSGYQSVTPK